MTKTTGLGDNLYVAEFDLSGDVVVVDTVSARAEPLQGVTGIDKHALERLNGKRDGEIACTSWFNPSAGQQHDALSAALPSADVLVTYARGTTLGDPAACLRAKQATYVGTRGEDGSFTFTSQFLGNGVPVEWGEQLTGGLDTAAVTGNGSSVDGAASTSLGWQAYLHVTAFSGTDATITLEDSANNSEFASFTGSAFTEVTGVGSERIQGGRTATVRRYVRYALTGTFTSITFAVVFVRNRATPVI